MEHLRQLAELTYNRSADRFRVNSTEPLRLVQLALNGDEATATDTLKLTEGGLLAQLEPPHEAGTGGGTTKASPAAALRLIVVSRALDDAVEMSSSGFRQLFTRFDIDPLVLQHIVNNSYGFHAHEAAPFRDAYSYYMGTFVYSLAWSFNPATMRTNAILLLRTSPVLQHGVLIRESFLGTLRQFRSRLYAAPFLLFVVYVHLCTTSQQAVNMNVRDLREVETLTRHGPGRGVEAIGTGVGFKVDIDALSKAAQNIATTQVHLANLLRHEPYLRDVASYLKEPQVRSRWQRVVKAEVRARCIADVDELSGVLGPLEKLTGDLEPTVKYLQTRADCQSSVITSLMTHEDARLNTELAAAARRDSSAMRSIAMMTMIFLPATFFAALFAMPSMPERAQSDFWIYWVCSVPSTLIVFVTFRYHRSLKDAKQRQQQQRESERGEKTGGLSKTKSTSALELGSMKDDLSVAERGMRRR